MTTDECAVICGMTNGERQEECATCEGGIHVGEPWKEKIPMTDTLSDAEQLRAVKAELDRARAKFPKYLFHRHYWITPPEAVVLWVIDGRDGIADKRVLSDRICRDCLRHEWWSPHDRDQEGGIYGGRYVKRDH